MSLLLILAVAQSFATVSGTISTGRATLEMADVKVFDPMAPLKDSASGFDLIGPDDARYGQINVAPSGAGDFVDPASRQVRQEHVIANFRPD